MSQSHQLLSLWGLLSGLQVSQALPALLSSLAVRTGPGSLGRCQAVRVHGGRVYPVKLDLLATVLQTKICWATAVLRLGSKVRSAAWWLVHTLRENQCLSNVFCV